MTSKLVKPLLLAAVASAAASSALAAEFDTLYVERIIPFENAAALDRRVLGCDLGSELSANLRPYGRDQRITIVRSDTALTDEDNYVAIMITDVVNDVDRGDKSASAYAELYINGQSIAWTRVQSGADAFGAVFRPSCGILKKSMERLAEDIAAWLASQRSPADSDG